MTKLAATLPKNTDANGLDAISRYLVNAPEAVRVVVMLIDCKAITTDVDTGAREPTARILRVEALAGDDADTARKLLDQAVEQRTGRQALAFDPDTGEIFGEP